MSSPPPKPKPLHRFALQAGLLALLLGFLPGMQRVFPTLFNAQAEWVLNAGMQVLSDGYRVRVRTLDPARYRDRRDTHLVGYGPRASARDFQWRAAYRIHSRGWWPMAIALAMVAATPLPLRRRLLAALGAALIVNALVLLRVGLLVAVNFGYSESPTDPAWRRAHEVSQASFESWVGALVTVLIAWAAVARAPSTLDLESGWSWLSAGRRRSSRADPAAGEGAAGGIGGEAQQQSQSGSDGHAERGP